MALIATTVDNPYDPRTQYKQWFMFDFPRYNTLARISKLVPNCSELSESFQEEAWDDAVRTYASFMPTLYKVLEADDYGLDDED